MNHLATMGLPSAQQPKAYVHGLSQAPLPSTPSLRRNITRNYIPPTHRADQAVVQRAGAVIGGLAAALAQLDHFARQLQGLGQMKHQTKQKLGQLIALSDEVLAAAASQFESSDADAITALSDVLGQSAELLFQLRPEQIESALHHQNNMAKSNLAYVPATK